MCWGHLRNVRVGEMLAVSLAVKLRVNKSSPDTFPPELQLRTPGLLQDWAFTILILSWIPFLGSVDFFYFYFLNQISSLQKNGRKQKGSSWGVLLAVAIGLKHAARVSQLRLALRSGYWGDSETTDTKVTVENKIPKSLPSSKQKTFSFLGLGELPQLKLLLLKS